MKQGTNGVGRLLALALGLASSLNLLVVGLIPSGQTKGASSQPARNKQTIDRGTTAQESAATVRERVRASYGHLPLSFTANEGQFDERVKFLSRGQGYNLFLTSSEAVLVLKRGGSKAVRAVASQKSSVLRMTLKNASPQVE